MNWLFAALGVALGFALGWMLFSARTAGIRERLAASAHDAEKAHGERTEFHERAVKAEARAQALEQRLKEQQEQLRLEFQHTANKIFEEMSAKFSTQSEKKIGDLLHPLRERLGEFQKLVVDSFGAQGKEQHTLKSEIEKIVLQADSLTKALRGDVKAQGNWGEVMLERILEESGLRKDLDYIIQGTEMSLSGEGGGRLRPDVVVKLPEGKHIIVDAKVSLTSYERYCAEPDETHVRDFVKSVRAHVSGLEQKRYQDIEKLGAPDFVLMFMPTEGAFAFAMQKDMELHEYAWGRKVVIVCPSTLSATLKTVASLWRIESQNRYAQEIARQGGALYDKFVGLIEDMQAVGKQMARAQDSYDQAMNKLSTGRGNLIGAAEKLKQLGAKAAKSLPEELLDGEEEQEPMPRLAGVE